MACTRGSIIRKDTVAVEVKRRSGIVALLKTVSRQIGVTLCTVCYIDRTLYLHVSPAEPAWVTENTEAIFEVQSNTSWNID